MIYLDAFNGRIVKMASACGTPITIANLTNGFRNLALGSTDKEGFVAIAYNNSVFEYSVGSGGISKVYYANIE